MLRPTLVRPAILASTLALIGVLAAWSPAGEVHRDCTFSIRATNDTGADAWLLLPHSFWEGMLGTKRYLNLQNRRVRPGETVDLRYVASGTCGKDRNWTFYAQKGQDAGYWQSGEYTTTRRVFTRQSSERMLFLGRVSSWSWTKRP